MAPAASPQPQWTVMERFPFGAPIQPVTWKQAGPKPVVILGVYPSAVHARWLAGDGRTRIRALAVANEPEPFWTGQDAEEHIAAVAASVPAVVGQLVAASGHNGLSGQALYQSVLAPLGLDRGCIRIADIDNRYMANPAQQQAIGRCYNLLAQKGLVPPVSWRLRRPITKVPADRSPSLTEELEEASPDWVITLGNEPLRALRLPLLSPDDYGVPLAANIFGRSVRLLRLVHTRQQAQHGASSRTWAHLHKQWVAGAGAATVRRAISVGL